MTTIWTAAIGRYKHTAALLDGRVASNLLRMEFSSFPSKDNDEWAICWC